MTPMTFPRGTAFPMHHCAVRTENYFRNLIKYDRKQIVFTIFPLIWHQTDVCLVPNQWENGKFNLISVGFNKIFLCVALKTNLLRVSGC